MNPPSSPNVLLITVDHWPGRLLGCAGHPVIQTPTLDALAADGVRFPNAYSPCPVCIPSRRSLHTGLTPRSHGDRIMQALPLPEVPTLAQAFRDAGYQTFAVGKIHATTPPRHRIGFDDILLCEEGRSVGGELDDYELFLGDNGFPGEQFTHGMSNNGYTWRPWHLPEKLHVTNWATRAMARQIQRKDPTRPAFYYLSYTHPHPPLAPLACYLDLYRDAPVDPPFTGEWARDFDALPEALRGHGEAPDWQRLPDRVAAIRRAFYALCTHIDHQLRLVLGTLKQCGLLKNTLILFCSDHGDLLGNHGLWRKRAMYEGSANIPMILAGVPGDPRITPGSVDPRLSGLQDVMPTLLDLAGVPVPPHVEGLSLVGETRRPYFYSEDREGVAASRMVRNDRYKLIYYAEGNRRQLFDLQADPDECHDLAGEPALQACLERLTDQLKKELYGSDLQWLKEGELHGLPPEPPQPTLHRLLNGQRGPHWPPAHCR